jgi:hypothetical protein
MAPTDAESPSPAWIKGIFLRRLPVSAQIPVETFRGGLLIVLDELFENVHSYVLDPGTSLCETLATITAEEASRPVSPQSATLAAQVNHVRFYMDSLITGLASRGAERPDWPSSWQVDAVTDEEWADLVARLNATYAQIRQFAQTFEGWDPIFVGGAFALVAHCAYHLGEIRQGLGVVRHAAASVPSSTAR